MSIDTIEDLLKPRYKVIGKWPDMVDVFDNIIELPSEKHIYADLNKTHCAEDYFDAYPDCYKKLEWHDERELKDMPQFLKVVSGHFETEYGKVGKVKSYNKKNVHIVFGDKGECYRPIKDTVPVTETDYNEYIKSTQ